MIKRGKNKLGHADSRFIIIIDNLEKVYPGNFIILETHRDKERQDKLNAMGKSQVKYPNSKHNKYPSKAVDMIPLESNGDINWDNRELFTLFAGYALAVSKMKGYDLRWGGDWNKNGDISDNKFDDLPHFELE